MNGDEAREPLNSVKSQVRESALELKEFTIAQMVIATGCKRASVQTELGRMVKQGYLVAEPLAGPHERPGKPQLCYRLSEDREKLESLIRSVKSFHRAGPQRASRPKGRHYTLARSYLEKVVKKEYQSDAGRKVLLDEAAKALELAWADEGDTGTVTDAYIRYEQAKLLYWKEDHGRAEALFLKARQIFAASEEYESEVAKIDQYLSSLQLTAVAGAGIGVSAAIRFLRKLSSNLSADFPLPAIIQSVLTEMVSPRQRVLQTARQRLAQACEVPEYIRVVGSGTFGRRVPLERAFCTLERRSNQEVGAFSFETGSLRGQHHQESRELAVAVRGAVDALYSASIYDLLVEERHGQGAPRSIVEGNSVEV